MKKKPPTSHDANPSDDPLRKPRRWFRRSFRGLLLLAIVAVLGAAGIPHVAAPLYWRWVTKQFLEEYWTGRIQIRRVEFSWDGTAVLENVSFRDDANREWVHVNRITYSLRDFPSLHPVLYEISIDRPQVTAYLDEGLLNLPMRTLGGLLGEETEDDEADASALDDYLDVQRVFVNDISLTVVEADSHFLRERIRPTPIRFLRNLRFWGTASAGGDIAFRFGPQEQTRARAEFRLRLSRLVVQDLRELLHQPPLAGAETQPLVLDGLVAPKITYHDDTLRIPWFSARLGPGRLTGRARFHRAADSPLQFEGDLTAKDISLRRFYDAYDPTQEVHFGRVFALVDDIQGNGRDLRALQLDGAIFMDDSDLDGVHVVEDVLETMKVDLRKIRNGSDLRAIFRLRGGVLQFAQARLGNNLVAVLVEPGAAADIPTRQIHMHVLGGWLHDLGKLPLIGWLARMTNQLTALQITGDWREPQVRICPVRNVSAGVEEFFREAVKTGGQLHGPENETP